ncbi:ABC transporter permease [bacterium]|nr:ABC transporter permease [bacterium]
MGTALYFLREVLINLRRSPLVTLSAVSTVMVLQLILGSFALLWLNLDYWTLTFTQQVQVVVFLDEDVSPEALEKLQKKIQTVGHVTQVRFVDRDEAFRQLQKEMKGKIQLEDVGENPLPDRFDVRVDEARFLAAVADKIFKLPGVYKVKYGGDIAKRLINLSKTVSWVGGALSGLLVLATVTVVGNTIRLTVFARRREIEIMQMVGAARWFIQVPFVVEGIAQGLCGSALAIALLNPAYTNLALWIQDTLPFLPTLPAEQLGQWLYPLLLSMGALVGALGSLVSVNRYLKI